VACILFLLLGTMSKVSFSGWIIDQNTFGNHGAKFNPLTLEAPISRMNWVEYRQLNLLPKRDLEIAI
jgi:hypothetical protein